MVQQRHTIAIGCLVIAWIIGLAYGTCVLDSDFGFILNCNFKKSSLFRVRNLGGFKAHFGLGFSVGDELGFPESLGNVEGSKRRSLSQRDSVLNNVGVLPASRQTALPTTKSPNLPQQNRPRAVIAWQPPPPAPLPFSSRVLQVDSKPPLKLAASTMTGAVSLPLGVPAFRPIPSGATATTTSPPLMSAQNGFNTKMLLQYPVKVQMNNLTFIRPQQQQQQHQQTAPAMESMIQKIPHTKGIPSFHALPSSVSRISTELDGTSDFINQNAVYNTNQIDGTNIQKLQIRQVPNANDVNQLKLPQIDLMGHTVEELASIANVSVEAIQRAIQMKQQQILVEQQTKLYQQHMEMIRKSSTTSTTTSTTTTTTTTPAPITPAILPTKKHPIAGGNKVMNAPKEYYPVGYEKNFDDNFISKVDLPKTSFYCGDQKHFPGLYADTDLGCMVFHVCALTDDGLIMKSFLCPESTLFDQTVLKCNWWFYVDCKSSKSLYDSNLPVSKSYQLMKALTFFSSYKNSGQNDKGGVDVEALKNSVASKTKT